MKIKVKQQSEAWFNLKQLKLSASYAQAIASSGKGLRTLVMKLLRESYSTSEPERFRNKHTDRGNELEKSARFLYSVETGNEVIQAGFETYDKYSEHVGVSPDGYVPVDGLVEIKCPDDKAFFEYMESEKIDTGYLWQMQMQMLVCGRSWCDYVVYNPNFKKEIIIARVIPDSEKFEKLEAGFVAGIEMLEDIKRKIDWKLSKNYA